MLDPKNTTIAILLAVIVYFIREKRVAHFNSSLNNIIHNSYLPPQQVHEKLKAHSSQFSKAEILRVTDGVYVAIGYALANSIIIECDTTLTIVDTLESVESSQQVRNDFIAMTHPSIHSKPVGTIIYTHYHPDHTFGSGAWIDAETNFFPTIISHRRTMKGMSRVLSISSAISNIRGIRQFGPLLHEYDQTHYEHHDIDSSITNNSASAEWRSNLYKLGNNTYISDNSNGFSNVFENSGIGPFLLHHPQFRKSMHMPTKLLDPNQTTHIIDGVEMEIVHAPGETADQIFIYLPEKRILLPADNIYQTFPNIYAIRGTPTRDARDWTKSLDAMRSLEPAPLILVPAHMRPVYGEDKIQELLTVYRDGISYTHDQTIRYMNMGLTPDEMLPLIHENMPERLKNHPYLQEMYGTMDWSVRGIFHSYLGWFSGDAADLFPLPKSDLGDRLIDLLNNDIAHIFGVIQGIIEEKEDRNSCQWGLQLATELLHSTKLNEEEKQEAKYMRTHALQCMASFMTSANGRNYYLTSALEEITGSNIVVWDEVKEFVMNNVQIDQVIAMLRVRLKVDVVSEPFKNVSVCHDFEDLWYLLEIRDGIVEIFKGSNYNIESEVDDTTKALINEAYITRFISRKQCHSKAKIVTLCSEQVFRDAICATQTTPAQLYASGKFKIIKGKIADVVKLRDMFEKQ